MNHEQARKRVCALCVRRLPSREITKRKTIDLCTNKEYHDLLVSILPGYSIENSQHPSVLCAACGRAMRHVKSGTASPNLAPSQEFLSRCKRKSPRNFPKEHCDCEVCQIALPQLQNFQLHGPVPKKRHNFHNTAHLESKTSNTLCNTPEFAYVSCKDIKQIQAEWGLTQTQALGVTRSFRYATKGALHVEPGLKDFLTVENETFEDIFEVC